MDKVMWDREKGKLPSTSQVNSKKSVMTITLRSSRELEEPSVGEKPQDDEGENVVFEKENCEKKGENLQEQPTHQKEIKPYMPPIRFPQLLKPTPKPRNLKSFLRCSKRLIMLSS